jgi:hypothetical protein
MKSTRDNTKHTMLRTVTILATIVAMTFVQAGSASAVIIGPLGNPTVIQTPVQSIGVPPIVRPPIGLPLLARPPIGVQSFVRPPVFNPFFRPPIFNPFFVRPFFNPFFDVDVDFGLGLGVGAVGIGAVD